MIIKFYKVVALIVFLICIYYTWKIATTDQNTIISSTGKVMERGISYHDSSVYELHRDVQELLDKKETQLAEQKLFDLIYDFPDYVGGYILLGHLQIKQNKLKKAQQTYLMAIKIKPDHHQPYARLAYVEEKLGNCEEAIKQYNKALDYEYYYAKAHYGIASCSYQLEKMELASFHANKTIELENDKAHVKAAEELLELIAKYQKIKHNK